MYRYSLWFPSTTLRPAVQQSRTAIYTPRIDTNLSSPLDLICHNTVYLSLPIRTISQISVLRVKANNLPSRDQA